MRHEFSLAALVLTAATLAPSQGRHLDIERGLVAGHNAVRAKVGVGPLAWSDDLAKIAQNWADKLIASGEFQHSRNPGTGENLYEITGAGASPDTVINAWAGEAKDYNYSQNTCRGVCGHYTQMVWADTKEVGCAIAQRGRREVWVCEYSPAGNYVGKKPY